MTDVIEKMARALDEFSVLDLEPIDRAMALASPEMMRAAKVRAALAAAEAAGWVLVPRVPTQYMKDLSGTPRAADVWRSMLAARPMLEKAPKP
jgi:hypothetical protein